MSSRHSIRYPSRARAGFRHVVHAAICLSTSILFSPSCDANFFFFLFFNSVYNLSHSSSTNLFPPKTLVQIQKAYINRSHPHSDQPRPYCAKRCKRIRTKESTKQFIANCTDTWTNSRYPNTPSLTPRVTTVGTSISYNSSRYMILRSILYHIYVKTMPPRPSKLRPSPTGCTTYRIHLIN